MVEGGGGFGLMLAGYLNDLFCSLFFIIVLASRRGCRHPQRFYEACPRPLEPKPSTFSLRIAVLVYV